jgi:hypothetical protein
MNDVNTNYKGIEKRDDGDFHVYDVEMDDDDETDFHIPSGLLLEFEGKSQLRYLIFLSVESPELMQEHVITILDGHIDNWMKTDFSGDVNFQCWNDMLEPEHMEPVGDILHQILAGAQNVIDTNKITSADGNRVVLRASLHKFASEATH